MTNVVSILVVAQAVVLAIMFVLYLCAVRWKDMGLVDLGWTLGVAVAAVLFAVSLEGHHLGRRLLVASMAGIWALRLSWYLLSSRIVGKGEDARYRALRARWGHRARVFVPLLFIVEAPLALFFSLPLMAAMLNPSPSFTVWDAAGVALWVIAVTGEAVADRQLDRFRRRPEHAGMTCREGLWGYSRHPNYFFEWLHWWAYVPIAVGTSYAWVALLGPLVMLAFLFGVTGIPHTERQALAHRGEDYRRYQQTTSVFFPWFRRKEIH